MIQLRRVNRLFFVVHYVAAALVLLFEVGTGVAS
jgi:hypothetical protein